MKYLYHKHFLRYGGSFILTRTCQTDTEIAAEPAAQFGSLRGNKNLKKTIWIKTALLCFIDVKQNNQTDVVEFIA